MLGNPSQFAVSTLFLLHCHSWKSESLVVLVLLASGASSPMLILSCGGIFQVRKIKTTTQERITAVGRNFRFLPSESQAGSTDIRIRNTWFTHFLTKNPSTKNKWNISEVLYTGLQYGSRSTDNCSKNYIRKGVASDGSASRSASASLQLDGTRCSLSGVSVPVWRLQSGECWFFVILFLRLNQIIFRVSKFNALNIP